MKATTTRGWYYFEDGTKAWFSGLSPQEKRFEIYQHGKIVKFIHTA